MFMKLFTILLLALIMASLSADPRIHLGNQDVAGVSTGADTCHFPFDTDTNNEYKVSGCKGRILQQIGNVSASVRFIAADPTNSQPDFALASEVPFVPDDTDPDGCRTVSVQNVGNCSVVDDDGTAYTSSDWKSLVSVCLQPGLVDRYTLRMKLACNNAVAN